MSLSTLGLATIVAQRSPSRISRIGESGPDILSGFAQDMYIMAIVAAISGGLGGFLVYKKTHQPLVVVGAGLGSAWVGMMVSLSLSTRKAT